uniref:Uncharacterized protein n=1 Tax=Rhizophora mucronata TaxID=61149 RepID=A0A2P2P6R9_RHIMU
MARWSPDRGFLIFISTFCVIHDHDGQLFSMVVIVLSF